MKPRLLPLRLASALVVFSLLSLLCDPRKAIAQDQPDERNIRAQTVEQVKQWPGTAKRWALIIGVDQYKDRQVGSLNGAANDARLLSEALIQRAGFPSDQVILLATDQPEERQPTRVNILRRLSNLASVVPKDGLLFLSFAGHGMERGGQAFLLPSDAQISDDVGFLEETSLSVARIKERIKATGVQQVVLLLDACRNDPVGRADAPNKLTAAYTRGFNFDLRNKEVTAFATLYATAVGERAYEYTEKSQGYFTWAVVEGLKGGAANGKGEITLSGLLKYIQEAVPKRIAIDLGSAKEQHPFAIIEGYKADELVIAVAGPVSTGAENKTSPGVDSMAVEITYWDSIKNSSDREDFKAYLQEYPNGRFVTLAKNRLNNLTPKAPEDKAGRSGDDVTGSIWQGPMYHYKESNKLEGYLRYTFLPGGVFHSQYIFKDGVTMENTFIGTWTQIGDRIDMNIPKTKSTSRGVTSIATVKGNLMEGTRVLHGGPWTGKALPFKLQRVQ